MQAIHAVRSFANKNYVVLRGVSLVSVAMSIFAEGAWFSYAVKTGATAGYLNALIALVSYACISLTIMLSGLETRLKTSLALASTVAFPGMFYFLTSVDLISVLAPALSFQFVPQVVKTIKSYGTPSVFGFSPVSATAVVVFNALWLTYGIVNADRVYAVSASILLTCGVLILVTQALSVRKSRAASVHSESACL